VTLAARQQAGPPTVVRGKPCSIAVLLAALPKAEAEALRGILADGRWVNSAIFDMLGKEGHEASLQTIGRHRRGHCRCGPS